MDYVAESEGKKALAENRALQEDPAAEVPGEARRACLKTIRRAYRKKSARSAGHLTTKVLYRIIVVALLSGILLCSVFAAFPDFRAGTLNIIFDILNEGVEFSISTESLSARAGLEDLCPSILPDGYELVEQYNAAGSFWVYYRNEFGDRLEINLSTGALFDTQGAEVEHIQVYGFPAFLIDQINVEGESHGIIKVIIVNEAEGYLLSVMSIPHSTEDPPPIDRETAIRIAESIFE